MISARILEQENPEFEASLAYVLTCLSGDVGATAKLTSCFGIPVERQSRKNGQMALGACVETAVLMGEQLRSTTGALFGCDRTFFVLIVMLLLW